MNKAILFGMWLIGNNDYEDVKRMYEDWERNGYKNQSSYGKAFNNSIGVFDENE